MKFPKLFDVFYMILFMALVKVNVAERISYRDYKLIDVDVNSLQALELLQSLKENPDFDLWTELRNTFRSSAKVLLSPWSFQKYRKIFDSNQISFKIISHNIQDKINQQTKPIKKSSNLKSIVGIYAKYDEIIKYINDKVDEHPNMTWTYDAGYTYENRTLKVIVIRTSTSQRKIWIDCGIHAREWITTSTCIWMIEKLLEDYRAGQNDTVELLNFYEIHILPVVNPDGYAFTHTTDRMWRKNRSPNNGSECVGTDLNRNFGYYWNLPDGSSNDSCSLGYKGFKHDSELETRAVQNAILKHRGEWDAFLTLHSYGQLWFTPFAYTTDLPPNYEKCYEKVKIGADALSNVYKNGSWEVGTIARILYTASGSSADWTYGVADIKYSHGMELRPGETGPDSDYGFVLPEDRVPLAGQETYVGIRAFLNSIKNDPL